MTFCVVAGAASEPVPPLPTSLPVSPVADRPPANQGFPSHEKAQNLPQQSVPQEQVASSSVLARTPEHSSAANFSLPRTTSQQSFAPRKTSLGQFVPGQVLPGNGNVSPSGEGFGPYQMQGLQQGAQRTPSLQNAPSGVSYPARKSSAAQIVNSPHPPPSSFSPGQVMPPARSASITRSPPPVPDQDPSMGGAPHRVYSSTVAQGYIQQPSLQHQPSVQSLHHRPLVHSSHHQAPPNLLHQRPSIHQHHPHPQSVPPQSQFTNFSQRPIHAQSFPSRPMGPGGPPHGIPPPRSPSEPPSSERLHKASSSRSLHSQYEYGHGPGPAPPLPSLPGALPMPPRPFTQRHDSFSSVNSANGATMKPLLPSQQMGSSRANSFSESTLQDPSPPASPVEESKPLGPVKSIVSESLKCRVFHQQQHAQWKALGSAHLTLYRQEPTNVKQLVVKADSKDKIIVSTIVLTDGVERVGKTGVAVELSNDKGARTGIIYMIQLRNEKAAGALFDKLLEGSDRSK